MTDLANALVMSILLVAFLWFALVSTERAFTAVREWLKWEVFSDTTLFFWFGLACGAWMIALIVAATNDAKANELTQIALPSPSGSPVESIPSERIQPIVDRAAKWLNAKGHHVEPIAPAAYYTRLNGFDGISVDGDIVVNSESIPECFAVIVAHEFVHLALGRSEGATPSQSEQLAREIEQDASDDYVPNCKTEP